MVNSQANTRVFSFTVSSPNNHVNPRSGRRTAQALRRVLASSASLQYHTLKCTGIYHILCKISFVLLLRFAGISVSSRQVQRPQGHEQKERVDLEKSLMYIHESKLMAWEELCPLELTSIMTIMGATKAHITPL